MPKARRKPSEWKAKLRPIFFAVAQLLKTFEIQRRRIQAECDRARAQLPPNATPEEQRAPVARMFEQLKALLDHCDARMLELNEESKKTPFNRVPFSYLHPSADSKAAHADWLTLKLHWDRHGESLEAAHAKDSQADLRAFHRLARTALDYRLLVHGKPGLKPFKSDELHSNLLEWIMTWEIEPLTADERAECFDEYCPCQRRKGHDANALKKQHNRLRMRLGVHPSQNKDRTRNTPESEG